MTTAREHGGARRVLQRFFTLCVYHGARKPRGVARSGFVHTGVSETQREEKQVRRHGKTVLLVGIVAAVALSVVAVAYGATTKQNERRAARGGACGALMSNPQALKDMRVLRAEHPQEMQAWSDRYGADPSSTEARTALQKLRQEHWSDMRELFKKYGITAPRGAGPGSGQKGGGCGGACGGAGSGSGSQGAGYGMMGSGGGMMGGGWSY
jgi:hypothetical protein